jgi:ABC-type dipeptide/oligopeptide/nickel transport system permease component
MADDELASFRRLSLNPTTSAASKEGPVARRLRNLSDQAAAERRTDYIRLTLSISIMIVYLGSVLFALYLFGSKTAVFPRGSVVPGTIDPYSAALFDVLKVMVLPVVTLMLGFYFGTGASARSSK